MIVGHEHNGKASAAAGRLTERTGVVIPAHNEAARISSVISGIRRHVPLVLVVDDGSDDDTAHVAGESGAFVLSHASNRGKGAALQTAFKHVLEHCPDCEWVITMDGDGQHLAEDLPKFLEAYERTRIPVLLGNRMNHRADIPFLRRWTNVLMSWIISREMQQYIPDTQCGYRLYHRAVLPFLDVVESGRFAAESEILLQLADRGFRMDSVRVKAVYSGTYSHIRPVRDAIQFIRMMRRHRRSGRRDRDEAQEGT